MKTICTLALGVLWLGLAAWADTFWPFEPALDSFAEDALLDLRFLNHTRAGDHGWLATRDGEFYFEGDSKPYKFWAAATTYWSRTPWGADHERVDYQARRFAKLGINLVRVWPARGTHKFDAAHFDAFKYQIAAYAKQGIYSQAGFFWDVEAKFPRDAGEYKAGERIPATLLFFDEQLQQIYFDWARELFATPNPYAQVPLAKDPAVAIIELMNEDSLFFWTFGPEQRFKPQSRDLARRRFGDWLADKYGSLDAARARWGEKAQQVDGDDLEAGQVAFYMAWAMTEAGINSGQFDRERVRDQIEFLTDIQVSFYTRAVKVFREDFGYRGQIVGSNWHTSDPKMLEALYKYTETPCGVHDIHGYHDTSSGNRGGSFVKGSFYSDTSLMRSPDSLTKVVQYYGLPSLCTEYNYPMPNRYRAEFPWMGATYGSLVGMDSVTFNEVQAAGWAQKHNRFSCNTPVALGQFPALSLIFRRGYVRCGPVVYRETVRLDDLYRQKGAGVWSKPSYDEIAARQAPGIGENAKPAFAVAPLAFYVGQLQVAREGDNAAPVVTDPAPFIDRGNKVVRSATGELSWDWKQGLAVLDAPCAQALCGFYPQGRSVKTSQAEFVMRNDYGTAALVSLDDQPLDRSKTILLQVMTEDRNSGFEAEPARFAPRKGSAEVEGWQVVNPGGAPIVVRAAEGEVHLLRADAGSMEVVALDHNGYERAVLPGGGDKIELLPDCLYYVIRTKN